MSESVWMSHDNGKSYSVEMSTLEHSPNHKGGAIIVPDGTQVPFSSFQRHRDADNDITHWTLDRDGVKYSIWND